MDRREWLGLLGAGAAGLVAVGGSAREARAQHEHDKVHADCLKACQECAEACGENFHHCFQLVAQGKKEHAKSARLSQDCAEFCGLSACLITRHSDLMALACEACAEACKACGDECAKFSSDEMRRCAEACRKCEKTCKEMVRAMGHRHTA
jgi:hypothetical protein